MTYTTAFEGCTHVARAFLSNQKAAPLSCDLCPLNTLDTRDTRGYFLACSDLVFRARQ